MQDLLKTVLRPAPCRAHSLHLTVSFYGIVEVDPPVPLTGSLGDDPHGSFARAPKAAGSIPAPATIRICYRFRLGPLIEEVA